jgi:hypothetical protein
VDGYVDVRSEALLRFEAAKVPEAEEPARLVHHCDDWPGAALVT